MTTTVPAPIDIHPGRHRATTDQFAAGSALYIGRHRQARAHADTCHCPHCTNRKDGPR